MRKGVSKILAVGLGLVLALGACSQGTGDTTESVPEEAIVAEETVATLQASTVEATEENVRLGGRTCESDGVRWLAQSGSAIEFEVDATRVAINLVGDEAVENVEDLRPRFAVLLDGEVILDDILSEYTRTIEVFAGETSRKAVVELMQLSESNSGVVGVDDIDIESFSSTPIAPTSAKDLSIEFIGDSITCGYGVESLEVTDGLRTTRENFMKSYAYFTAKALDADCSAVCYSGYGIVSGWTGDGERNASSLLPPLYDVVARKYDQPWDFSTHPSDVVVINLGTNDTTYTYGDEIREAEFSEGYEDFLAEVRERNPRSHIVCTLGTMDTQELYPAIEQAVERFKERTGDVRVTSYMADVMDVDSDGAGAGWHPNEITQQKIADELTYVIRELL